MAPVGRVTRGTSAIIPDGRNFSVKTMDYVAVEAVISEPAMRKVRLRVHWEELSQGR